MLTLSLAMHADVIICVFMAILPSVIIEEIIDIQESQNIENASTNILHISDLDNSVTAYIIRRTVRWRGLSLPKDVRLVERGGCSSAFLEFRSIAEAEAMIEEFNHRLFSQQDNIAFLNLSAKKGETYLVKLFITPYIQNTLSVIINHYFNFLNFQLDLR